MTSIVNARPLAIAKRMASIRGTKNAALQELARSLIASGHHISDLTLGELDRLPPAQFLAAASAALDVRSNGYTETIGLPELRLQLAHYAGKKFDLEIGPERIAVTAGAKSGLYHVMLALLDPGDEVLIAAPYWPTFPEQVRLAGGVPTFVDLSTFGYDFVADAFASRVTCATKVIIVNSPNNPTGRSFRHAELEKLARMAAEREIYVIFDECYRDLIYTQSALRSFGEAVGEFDRFVIVDSFSKSWALTGWRLGFVCASPQIIKALGTIQTHSTSNPSSIAQHALLRTLRQGGVGGYIEEVRKDLERKCNWVVDQFAGLDLVSVPKPDGGFFVYVDVSRMVDGRRTVDSLCENLLREYKVMVVPGTAFGHGGGFRISFGGDETTVRDSVTRIVAFLKDRYRYLGQQA